MERRIAALLDGTYADLYAGICAIELAQRTAATVYVLCAGGNGSGLAGMETPGVEDDQAASSWSGLTLAIRLGEMRGVRVSCHVLEDREETLLHFFHKHDIGWLVIGVKDRQAFAEKTRWIESLSGKLNRSDHWYLPSFQGLVAGPWNEEVFHRILTLIRAEAANETWNSEAGDDSLRGEHM